MYYLLATYWTWFVVALLAGGAIGYWSSWRRASEGWLGRWPWWAVIAFVVGLVVAVLHGLPGRAGLYLETLLLLSFWYAIGGLLGIWLGRARSQDALVTANAAEDTRLAVAAKGAEDAPNAAAAKAAEDARLAAATKAAKDARNAAGARAAEQARLAVAAKAVEDARRAAAAKAAEDARNAAAAKAAEDVRLAAAAKAAEDARRAAAAKATEEVRNAAAAKAAEDSRLAAAAKAAEDARLAAAAKAAEDARNAAAAKAAEDSRLAAAAKAAEDAGNNAAAKAAEDARQAPAAKVTEAVRVAAAAAAVTPSPAISTQHPGTRPQGIAAPEGVADDLKLIKGIGPKNEKINNALGIYHFRQIANWTPEEAIWVGHHMAFPGRIEREHWIPQAKLLASGGDTDHSAGVKSGAILVDDSADAPLDAAAADALAKSLPEQAGAVDGEARHAGRRPYGLAAPLGGQPDDLKRIRGIGPQNEGRLHGLGIWHFTQIRAWSEENVKWVGSYLAFSGRIDREKWVDQARELAAGHETEFSRRAAAGKVASSKDDGSHGQGNVRIVK
jgi:predicted flap endonuclease-1-like 5' DNA nuclease